MFRNFLFGSISTRQMVSLRKKSIRQSLQWNRNCTIYYKVGTHSFGPNCLSIMNENLLEYNNNANSTNNTLEELPAPATNFGIAKIICALPGLFINVIFILTVIRSRRFRKNLILLCLLSFGDLLCSANVLSLGLSEVITNEKLYHLTNYQCFYERPHFVLIIFCTHIESIATVLVSIERAVAVWFPYQYNKCNRRMWIISACLICISITMTSFIASVIVTVKRGPFIVFQDMCYPSVMVSTEYSGFIFMLTIAFGTVSLLVYLTLFASILCNKTVAKRTYKASIANVQQKRQSWLLKISSILAVSAFVFIVIPYTILYVGRKDWSQTSYVGVIRRYTSYLMAANSFIGMALCIVASEELRISVIATLTCRKVERPQFVDFSDGTRISRISNSVETNVRTAEEQV